MVGLFFEGFLFNKDNFLNMDLEKNVIIFYDWQYDSFHISPEMLISDGWYDTEYPQLNLLFGIALQALRAGKRIANNQDHSYSFLEFDPIDQVIYKRILVEKEFLIDHKALFSNEWLEVK